MSETTLRGRLCALLTEPNPVSLGLALAVGLAGVGLYVSDLPTEGVGQAWFVAFLVAYGVGISHLLSERREG